MALVVAAQLFAFDVPLFNSRAGGHPSNAKRRRVSDCTSISGSNAIVDLKQEILIMRHHDNLRDRGKQRAKLLNRVQPTVLVETRHGVIEHDDPVCAARIVVQ